MTDLTRKCENYINVGIPAMYPSFRYKVRLSDLHTTPISVLGTSLENG